MESTIVIFYFIQMIYSQSFPPTEMFSTEDPGNETEMTEGWTNRTEQGSFVSDNSTTDVVFVVDNFTESILAKSTANPKTDVNSKDAVEETTTAEPEVPQQDLEGNLQEEHCLCDLKFGECDINCCCDTDCSSSDRQMFSSCQDSPMDSSGVCFPQHLLYTTNSHYTLLSKDGLLCIATDNFPQRLYYPYKKVMSSLSEFDRVWARRRAFSWPMMGWKGSTEPFPETIYKINDTIWLLANLSDARTARPLELPVSGMTALCGSTTRVQFLKDIKTECLRRIPQTSADCSVENEELKPFETLHVLASPNLVNSSFFEATPEEAFLRLQIYLCSNKSEDNCTEGATVPKGVFDLQTGYCSGIVESVHIVVRYNGSSGLTSCSLYLRGRRDFLESGGWVYKREYRVEFKRDGDERGVFERSGRPGYLIGHRVIFGRLREGGIEVASDPQDLLGLASASPGHSTCASRIPVLFGHNVVSTCTLHLNSSLPCQQLQLQVWEVVLGGVKVNETDGRRLEVLVSSLGDPGGPDNWAPVWLSYPTLACPQLPSSLTLRVLYALTGSISNPQPKIVGALASVEGKEPQCRENKDCPVSVVSSVVFTDVSPTPESQFAHAPVVEIKLPLDFFYPFLSAAPHHSSILGFFPILLIVMRLIF